VQTTWIKAIEWDLPATLGIGHAREIQLMFERGVSDADDLRISANVWPLHAVVETGCP